MNGTHSPVFVFVVVARRRAVQWLSALLIVALTGALSGAAEVRVTFPLDGHFREGRYMPVRVEASGAGDALRLEADGTVPTQLALGPGQTDAVVPWLALGTSIGALRWSAATGASAADAAVSRVPLKPLATDERLVAFAGDEPSAAAGETLFPGMRVVPVRLDATRRPLLAPAAAYESLDAVVLGAVVAQTPGAVGEADLRVLLAGGTAVAVRSDDRPGGAWPWERRGAFWVLRHDPVGPRGPLAPEAYEPTYGWPRGWPAGVRTRAVLFVAVAGIAAVAAGLWRSRWAAGAAAGAALLSAGGIAWWGATRSPVTRVGGTILTRAAPPGTTGDASATQHDRWMYHLALRAGNSAAPFRDLTHPVFFSRRQLAQLQQSGLRLRCTADGSPVDFVAPLEANAALAFVARSVSPGAAAAVAVAAAKPVTSQLYVLANRSYPGRIVGQVPPAEDEDDVDEAWGTVVIEVVLPSAR